MKERFKSIKKLMSWIQIIIYMAFFIIITSAYLFYITKNATASITTGVIASLFIFHYTIYLSKTKEKEIHYLKELQKYATNMTFYLQAGNNVLKALELSKQRLDQTIQKDIDKTIKKLQSEAKLDTDHFKKYQFSSINLFHKQLKIKYEAGGNTKDLFNKVNQSINFEIVKRDELFRRKNVLKKQVILMTFMVLSIPLFLAFASKNLYDVFLSTGYLAVVANILLFSILIVNLVFLQKTTNDTSIHF